MLRILKISVLALLIASSSTFSQDVINISGRVLNDANGQPIQNHPVIVVADDSLYISTYYTNQNGYFMDSLFFTGTIINSLTFTAYDCIGIPHDTTVYSLDQTIFVQFFICHDTIPPGCQADFIYFQEGQEPYAIRFEDLSTGEYDQWFWDFGDSTYSQEQNPVHTYNSAGTYLVCLTISSSTGPCNSLLCQSVAVINEECKADFDYEVNPINPMEINFFNLSTGYYTELLWDFGDGNFSSEENPAHIYAEAGDYQVCLSISEADSLHPCYDIYCQLLSIQGDTICVASFSYVLDSMPGNPNTYYFFDQSTGIMDSWYWEFGDGNNSFEQNPVHQYADSGQYQVCLTVSNSSHPNLCSDTYCTEIITPAYLNFGGLVWAGEYPLNNPVFSNDTGIVSLYRLSGNELQYIQSKIFFENGYYWFTGILPGVFVLKVGLTNYSTSFSKYIPTYYGDQVNWDAAHLINLTGNSYDMHIHMVPSATLPAGPGAINGYITFQGVGPASDQQVDVILSDEYNNPLISTIPDPTGAFEFNGLPLGTYLIKADLAGRPSEAQAITLSSSSPIISLIQLVISESGFYDIEETSKNPFTSIKIYPIPAMDWINVEVESDRYISGHILVYDILGKTVLERGTAFHEGRQHLRLNISTLPQGVYMLHIQSSNDSLPAIRKFVK
jgi:PKD repeat protein